jgi:ABC transporter DrrB family efflux protein
MRLARVINKEALDFIRDKGFILTLILEPLILILVFGYTFQADINHLNTIVIDKDVSNYSQKVIGAIDKSDYFERIPFSGKLEQAKEKLRSGGVRAVFYIPSDFDNKLKNATKADIYLYIDSSDYTIYNVLKGASGQVIKESLQEIVQLIVQDLEAERNLKQARVNEIQGLVDGIDEKAQKTLEDINDIKIGDSIQSLDELNENLNYLELEYPNLTDSITPIINKIGEMRSSLIDYQNKSSEINLTAHELDQTYMEIQSRMDTIHLELKTLKKEFLSFPMDINKQYLYGEISYFQYLTPAILTLVLFFIGVVLTTMNIVDERNSKTLFRISTTPLKKWELLGGKFFVFFIAGIIEAVYVLLLAIFLFHVQVAGSIFNAFLVLTLLMAASIGLGLLVSAIVKTMRQAIMLIPLVVIPAVLISQTFSPIEVMPKFMQYFSYVSPMLYSNVALREIMIKGTGITGVLPQIIILCIYALVTLLLGILITKKRIE